MAGPLALMDGETNCQDPQNISPNGSRKGGRKHEDLLQKYGGLTAVPADQVTTLMIRNLPRRYTEEALLHELEAFVGPGSYNFLYLPWDSRRSSNVGYAFVNFVDANTARSISEQLDGKPWRLVQTPKEIKIMPAHVQGIALNLVHYMGSMVVEDGNAHAPMVIHDGQRISFQEAVEIYCPPELVQQHCKGTVGAEAEKQHLNSQLLLTQVSTASSLGELVMPEHFDEHAWQIPDLSNVPSEVSALDLFSSPWTSESQYHSEGMYNSEGLCYSECSGMTLPPPYTMAEQGQAGSECFDRAHVLASDSYRVAWKSLNAQLVILNALVQRDLEGNRLL